MVQCLLVVLLRLLVQVLVLQLGGCLLAVLLRLLIRVQVWQFQGIFLDSSVGNE